MIIIMIIIMLSLLLIIKTAIYSKGDSIMGNSGTVLRATLFVGQNPMQLGQERR